MSIIAPGGDTCNVTEKNTLMTAYNKLCLVLRQFEELEGYSKALVEKLERTHDHPTPDVEVSNEKEDHKNIVDLFNDLSIKLTQTHDVINDNIHRVVNMVE